MTSQNPETLRPEEPKSEETTEEKTKTYENDILDPAIQRTLSQVEKQTDNDEQVREITSKFTEGLNDESRQGLLKEYGEVRQKVHKKIEEREWDRFIEEYPEKVAAYKENLGIRAALERREKKEEEGEKLEKKQPFQIESLDKRFELPDLEEAKDKKYPWAKTAESVRNFLSDKITDVEDTLEQLTKGVQEGTALYRQIQKESYFCSKEREKKGEAGTPEGDFFTAIEDLKALNKTKLEMLNQRWQRLDILSSETKGAQDEELNKLSQEKAEGLRKKGKKVDDIKCNDKARQEMIIELKEKITDKGVKKEIDRREEDRVTNLNTELKRVYNEIVSVQEAPGESEERKIKEKIAKELYEKAKEIAKALTGEDLGEKIRSEAKEEAAREGYKIITKQEHYNSENTDKMEKRVQQKRWGLVVKETWIDLPDAEKQKYENNIKKFAEQLEKQKENLAQQLEKKGGTFSRDVFYELMRSGYNPQDIKIKGLFSKRIILPRRDGASPRKMKIKEFQSQLERKQNKISSLIKDEAKNEMDRIFIEGRRRLVKRKNRKMGEIINRIVTPPESRTEKGAERKMAA